MKKTILFLCYLFVAQLLSAQNWQVSGVVTAAEDGLPLPGVSVSVTGTKNMATITNFEGKYSINVPKGKSLTFSYIGYKAEVKQVISGNALNVVLESDSKMLNEVVAIGYGTMKKSDLTGSVASVKADQLQRTPAAGLDQALQGRAAGVTVNANTGQPGAAAEVRIRGIGTVNNSAPIYVVDGVMV
ncbi:MAG TPA: carboxypeptidase-like regulatory domain-containing protein, partial [Paludibacter sp.]